MKKHMRIWALASVVVVAGLIAIPAISLAQPQTDTQPQVASQKVRPEKWPFHGSKLTHKLLIRMTALSLGIEPKDVKAQLKEGKTITTIAAAKRDDVLSRYDAQIDASFAKQVSAEKLPASVAEARKAWFKRDARLMLDQPGLKPPFPGLHEVHVVVISATVKVTGVSRADVRATLENCGTVAEVASQHGKTGADVANLALANLDKLMDAAVQRHALTVEQRGSWHNALQSSLNAMVTTHGLHVAGKKCAM